MGPKLKLFVLGLLGLLSLLRGLELMLFVGYSKQVLFSTALGILLLLVLLQDRMKRKAAIQNPQATKLDQRGK